MCIRDRLQATLAATTTARDELAAELKTTSPFRTAHAADDSVPVAPGGRRTAKQKTAYEIGVRLVGSEMCIRDSASTAPTLTPASSS